MAAQTNAGDWTQPYYGLQHYRGALPAGVRQLTISSHGGVSEWYAFGPSGFTPIQESTAPTADAARIAAVAWIRALFGVVST